MPAARAIAGSLLLESADGILYASFRHVARAAPADV
jgi:hypothetical protein